MKRIILSVAVSLILTSPVFAHDYYVDVRNCRDHYSKLNHVIYYAWAAHTKEGKEHATKILHERKGKSSNNKLKLFQDDLTQWKQKTPDQVLEEIKKANDNATKCFNRGP